MNNKYYVIFDSFAEKFIRVTSAKYFSAVYVGSKYHATMFGNALDAYYNAKRIGMPDMSISIRMVGGAQ